MDYFEVFGLPRRLRIDADELQRRFYELSRIHHPDFHQGASADEQARALEASALVNAAYRALRDPVARVEYVVWLEDGRETLEGATVKPAALPELLTEMFEIQEALGEARAGGLDDASRATLRSQRDQLRERYGVEEARLAGELAEAWDQAPAGERGQVLSACRQALATRAYLRTVIEDLSAVLGEDGARVSNRRH